MQQSPRACASRWSYVLTLLLLLEGCVREWMALGTGLPLLSRPVTPMA